MVEVVLLIIYAIGSTWYNIHQSEVIGKLTSDRDQYQTLAEGCQRDRQRERTAERDAANTAEVRRTESTKVVEAHRQRSNERISHSSDTCATTPVGDLANSVVDGQRRLVEELRQFGVQP
jgi:hypothetical protein